MSCGADGSRVASVGKHHQLTGRFDDVAHFAFLEVSCLDGQIPHDLARGFVDLGAVQLESVDDDLLGSNERKLVFQLQVNVVFLSVDDCEGVLAVEFLFACEGANLVLPQRAKNSCRPGQQVQVVQG